MPTAPVIIAQQDELLGALVKRGEQTNRRFRLSKDELEKLANEVVSNIEDISSITGPFRANHAEYLKNWRGTVEPKDFPYENASNVRVALTSYFIEQSKASLSQALIGKEEDDIVRFHGLADGVTEETLDEVNTWFNWELKEVVGIESVVDNFLHYLLVDGVSLVVPEYKRIVKDLVSIRQWDLQDEVALEEQIAAAIATIFYDGDPQISDTVGGGKYDVEYRDDQGEVKKAKLVFWIENADSLCCEISREETIFDGVKVCAIDNEDLCSPNSHPEVDGNPFISWRYWLSAHEFIAGVGKEFLKFTEEEVKEILSHSSSKEQSTVPMATTAISDSEEGTDSRDLSLAGDPELGWLEVYRWEGRWMVGGKKVGLAVWVVPSANKVIRYERLESLTRTGERTPIKFDYIIQPGRFFSIGLAEWIRHNQAIMDAIANQRLDAGMMSNFPFFFYTPSAGSPNAVLSLAPGKGYPMKDPKSVVFPKTQWSAVWSFQEEAQALQYAKLQAGMSDASFGSFVSKRTSASEFSRTTEAIDIRTYMMVRRILKAFMKLLQRIFELYQRHIPQGRIFQVAGPNGEKLVRKLNRENLNAKMLMTPTGGADRINEQLVRDTAINMFQILSSPSLVQTGISQPDTLYAALRQIMKSMNYKGVPIHEPDMPKLSEPPQAELRRMIMGEMVEPSPVENFGEHLAAHMRTLSDPAMQRILKPETLMALQQHVQATQALQQQVMLMREQQALDAQGTQDQLTQMGVRPGKAGGQQAGDGASPGTQEEGVAGGPSEGSAPTQ